LTDENSERELSEAKSHLFYWKRQLRLDHFDFEVILMNPEENQKRLADCKIAPKRHRQKIAIRHPDDRARRDKSDFRRDLEVVIVHELLHTAESFWRDHPKVTALMDEDKWLQELHEDSLDAVAEALVRARRGILR